ncbi:hypothetical protein PHJA_000784300 [Phtheirospermum japonicum]|uniref:Uncharacterized protein n=1 Tax=Phtheirospermum japonicum TaxID=374723 RepID=A0A830BRM6_9LAMI|nr:hypothetical protein PHJA_000784300 [Phtheirospermum japonicum]
MGFCPDGVFVSPVCCTSGTRTTEPRIPETDDGGVAFNGDRLHQTQIWLLDKIHFGKFVYSANHSLLLFDIVAVCDRLVFRGRIDVVLLHSVVWDCWSWLLSSVEAVAGLNSGHKGCCQSSELLSRIRAGLGSLHSKYKANYGQCCPGR